MLVLALDTATPAVTAGVVRRSDLAVLGERVEVTARAHGELLTPLLRAALDDAGVRFAELGAVVCGAGPGPFTSLRVGMVTAAAVGDAVGLPVHSVCTLDAIAWRARALGEGRRLLVASDARRREIYWARYEGGQVGDRIDGPHVGPAAEVDAADAACVAGTMAATVADVVGLASVSPTYPDVAGLVALADLEREPAPLTPMYLRRPDAVEPPGRKRVSQ